MSTIDPTTIDVNYPIPGQDNDSQGFRDNFFNTRRNFEFAATELDQLNLNFSRLGRPGPNGILTLWPSTSAVIPAGWSDTNHKLVAKDAANADVEYKIIRFDG